MEVTINEKTGKELSKFFQSKVGYTYFTFSENGIEVSQEGIVLKLGENTSGEVKTFVVSSRNLTDTLKAVKTGDTTFFFDDDGNGVVIKDGVQFSTFFCDANCETPLCHQKQEGVEIDSSREIVEAVILASDYVASVKVDRLALRNVMLDWVDGGDLKVLATEGYKMVHKQVGNIDALKDLENKGIGIPIDAKKKSFFKAMQKKDCRITINNDGIEFNWVGHYRFFVGYDIVPIENDMGLDKYPRWRSVIPENHKFFKFDADEWLKLVKRYEYAWKQRPSKSIKFSIGVESASGSVEIDEDNEVNFDMPIIEHSENEQFMIAFHAKYLELILKSLKGKTVKLSYNNNLGATILTDVDDYSSFFLLMPTRFE